MNKTATILLSLLISACATTSKNPPPDTEFTAQANFSHSPGSQELALEQAQKTCKHWGAVPGVISSQTVDLSKPETAKDTIGQISKNVLKVRLFDAKNPFETTLTFKCYQ